MEHCALEHPYQSGRHDDGAPLRPGGDELSLRAFDGAAFAAGQRVLDLGCGVGVATRLLHARGCLAFALDRAHGRLVQARRYEPGLLPVAADGRQLPFANDSLDGIISECAFSLIGYSADLLSECRRVLRPGGRLALTDLYARAGAAPDVAPNVAHNAATNAPPAGCLGGMTTRDAIFAALSAAGLRVETWQDHTPRLKSFVAQLMFSGQCAKLPFCGDDPAGAAALRARRPGYFLLIAAKPERSENHE